MPKKIESWEIDEKDRIITLDEKIAHKSSNTETVELKRENFGGGKVYKLIIKKTDGTLLHEYILGGKIPPDVGED